MKYDHENKRWKIEMEQSQSKKDDSAKDGRARNEEEKSDKQSRVGNSVPGTPSVSQNYVPGNQIATPSAAGTVGVDRQTVTQKTNNPTSTKKAGMTPQEAQDNKLIQLMILLGAGEIEDCKWNAQRMYEKAYEHKKQNLTLDREGEKQQSNSQSHPRWLKADTYNFVNIGLIYVKCILMMRSKGREDEGKGDAVDDELSSQESLQVLRQLEIVL